MATRTLTTSPVVSEAEWRKALQRLRERENLLNEAYEVVNSERRRLPMVEITTDYRFGGPDGELTLAELFNGQSHLVTYHFMYAPEWDKGCPHCTAHVEGLGNTTQLRKRDIEFALISRAPVDKLQAWKQTHGWVMPWYSCETAFSEAMGALPEGTDMPAMNVFSKDDDGRIYRTYFTDGYPILFTKGQRGIINLTHLGAPGS